MKRIRLKFPIAMLAMLLLLVTPRLLLAQDTDGDAPQNMHEIWRAWDFDLGSVIGLAISAILYAGGLWRMWRKSGIGHGIRRWEAGCFWAGWLVLTIALVSPIHPLGEILFSAHMVQHELLMLVAAPLLVLGRPMIGFLHGMPVALSGALGRLSNTAVWKSAWGAISAPFAAWSIHAIVLWGWHAPVLFQATLHSDWVHAAQHTCFIFASILFWWAIIHGHRGRTNYGVAVLYLFTTAIHSGLLGALLTFARTQWYPDYNQTSVWGLSSMEDQQLGGLIMWVPACTVYILVGLVLFAKWIDQSGRDAYRPALAAERRNS